MNWHEEEAVNYDVVHIFPANPFHSDLSSGWAISTKCKHSVHVFPNDLMPPFQYFPTLPIKAVSVVSEGNRRRRLPREQMLI